MIASRTGTGFVSALVLIAAALNNSVASAQELSWPKEIVRDEGTIIVYQPQPERLSGNVLSGRAAMSLELKDQSDPIFGVVWFTTRIDTDADSGIATLRGLEVTKVAWPDSNAENEARFAELVESAMPNTGFEISMERLSASLESAEVVQRSLENLKSDPPKIVFSEDLAVLLLYDGEPRFSDIENSDYERALNTPFAVARNKKTNSLYLSSGNFWYLATDPMGPWSLTNSPPEDLEKMMPEADSDQPAPIIPPKIVTASEPTELISTAGKPDWNSLSGGNILYVKNTETAWLRETDTGKMFVLLSGRWFESRSQDGPWIFVRPDQVPESFKEIPPASDIGGTRVSVAGTEEAEQAITDAAIPQTAAIKRDEAKLDVQYDGAPKFEQIPSTSVSYAVNTGAQVLEVDGKFYAVDNGVWFASAAATGPWIVADSIPNEEIQKIPPSSPVYNTTYVQIYDSTPEIVYVGYYPGYMWSFPYYGVPVYGTGWYYPPYWGGIYYPRPATWGLHVGYNPWTGWNYGVSWSNGFMSVGVSWGGGYSYGRCCGGWYGGGYHRGPTVINTGDINIGNSISIGNQTNIGNKISNDSRLGSDRHNNHNLYSRPENVARNADRSAVQRDMQMARPATNRANDVFADRNGNVARRNGDDWDTRQDNSWKPEQRTDRQPQPSTRNNVQRPASFDRREMDRAHTARTRGASREMARPRGGGQRRRR